MGNLVSLLQAIKEKRVPIQPVVDWDDVRRWLRQYGYHYLGDRIGLGAIPGNTMAQLSEEATGVLLSHAQEFLGLIVDGKLGPKTMEAMSLPRCGTRDHRRRPGSEPTQFHEACQLQIGVYLDFTGLKTIGDFSPQAAEEVFWDTLNQYEALVNVDFCRVDRKSKALIEVHVGPANRGVLAWMEVFDGYSGQHSSRYNQDVIWDEDLFVGTALHENGHGLGVDHSPNGIRSIMAPVHDPTIEAVVDEWLLNQLVPRYGKVTETPPIPVPQPDEGDDMSAGGIISKIPPEVWAAIFNAVLKMFEDCSTEETALSEMKNPIRCARRIKVTLWRKRKSIKLTREERNVVAARYITDLVDSGEEERREYVQMAMSKE